ncbi:ArsR family transcriptional regulator [Halalkalicoccus sp. GCM10025322]|uniref:ArsR family transcriptional regulator n=1 Tax=Halalkalicoccus TaxID=332246 RepID=UPI00361203AB
MLGSQCGNSANSHDQEVLHPLIDEQIIVREAITEFVDSTRLDTLRLLREQTDPATLTEISDEGSMSRQTVSSHIADFLSIGLVNHNPESSNYWLTAGGLIVLDSTEHCLEQITQEELSSLTRSPPPLQLLRLLNTTPIDPPSLSSKPDTTLPINDLADRADVH